MTNFEKWIAYTDRLTSPQNYIEWTWRSIIASSLQRRVWLPPDDNPCYSNIYTILVGPAGVGKGLCLNLHKRLLSYWKLKDVKKIRSDKLEKQEDKNASDAIVNTDIKAMQEAAISPANRKVEFIDPSLIPLAADATTYEALVKAVSESYARINYIQFDEKLQKNISRIYGHSSLAFSLPELGSLLRKRTDDTINYLLGLYDCPIDYIYDTKTQGKDRVRHGCLNIIAGTTPDFMQEILDSKLFNQGFGSRTFCIYANKERKIAFRLRNLTDFERQCEKELLDHLLKLSTLYGKVDFCNGTWEYLEDWWQSNHSSRLNKSPKLEGYYSRKRVHIMKVAMTEHFSESVEMKIPQTAVEKAIQILSQEEKSMHLAVTMTGKNPTAIISSKVLEILEEKGPQNFIDLHASTWDIANRQQIEEALNFLQETDQIETDIRVSDDNKQIIFYKIK